MTAWASTVYYYGQCCWLFAWRITNRPCPSLALNRWPNDAAEPVCKVMRDSDFYHHNSSSAADIVIRTGPRMRIVFYPKTETWKKRRTRRTKEQGSVGKELANKRVEGRILRKQEKMDDDNKICTFISVPFVQAYCSEYYFSTGPNFFLTARVCKLINFLPVYSNLLIITLMGSHHSTTCPLANLSTVLTLLTCFLFLRMFLSVFKYVSTSPFAVHYQWKNKREWCSAIILIEEITACFKFPHNFPVKINRTLEEPLVILPWGQPEKEAGVTASQQQYLNKVKPYIPKMSRDSMLYWPIVELLGNSIYLYLNAC